MDLLVVMGTSAAYFYSTFVCFQAALLYDDGGGINKYPQPQQFFETSVFLLFFVWLGKALEERARERTADAITTLIGLQPQTVTIVQVKSTSYDLDSEGGEEVLSASPAAICIISEQVIDIGLVQVNSIHLF